MSSQKIKFCPKCDNKYYHQVIFESEEDKLVYFCRVCGNQDDDDITGVCVLNIQYDEKNKTNYENIINKYTKYDPTLPHINVPCPNLECKSNHTSSTGEAADKNDSTTIKHTDAIYIRYNHENMKHLYMCVVCDYVWKTHEV
jgi:DNA-directed RNA polymerase subunit M/transcription elongation factor TFIIS